MLIKLALVGNKRHKDAIVTCCKQYHSEYVPIIDNIFGILTDNPFEIAYGRESSDREPEVAVKTYVSIFNCLSNIIPEWSLFQKNSYSSPYEGLLLDNRFFLNLLKQCSENKIRIKYIEFFSKMKTKSKIEDPDDICEFIDNFHDLDVLKIVRVCINFKNKDIIINKSGYVDIASKRDFYQNNKDVIIGVISKSIGKRE